MPQPADLILADADIWCGDAARRWARALAIRGDRVVAVGTDEEVRALRGPRTEVVALAGKAVVPGFQDSHVHPAFGARNLLNVNLDDLHTKDGYLARIQAVADANPGLDWIVGGGWYEPAVRRHRRAPQGGSRHDRARPARVPAEQRRARRVGQLPGFGSGRHHGRLARPLGRLRRARRRRVRPPGACRRVPPTRCSARWWPPPASTSGRPTSVGRSRSSTRWASRGGRTRGSSRDCSRPTAPWTTTATSRCGWSRPCGGIVTAAWSRWIGSSNSANGPPVATCTPRRSR